MQHTRQLPGPHASEMDLSRAVLVASIMLSLLAMASGYLPPLFYRGAPSSLRYNDDIGGATGTSTTAGSVSGAVATRSTIRPAYKRLYLNKEDLPDESIRQIAAANQRVKELEEEYWKSLDADEIAIERKCASGLACLKAPGMLEKAAEYYTSAAELR